MVQNLIRKETAVAVIGLGYVGLPIALEFSKKTRVIGFDISKSRINDLKNNFDQNEEVSDTEFSKTDIFFTSDPEQLSEASFFIITVPTPIDIHNMPDLGPLMAASKTVGKVLKEGDYVVYESTVYPGCTEEECVPLLEKLSGLKYNEQFKVGYSPERINPGDKVHTLSKIVKVVSGSDAEALETVSAVYSLVVEAGIFKASSIKVAEAAKVIENTQRDLNIALMNELSLIFDKMGINTYDVLDAAGTKWNFLKFSPGLVGGHCIGVDPFYLTYKSQEVGYNPRVILSGRSINDQMGAYVGKKVVQLMIGQGKNIHNARVLVMGATFKENVADIRNSKVADLITELESFSLQVDILEPKASAEEFREEYGKELIKQPGSEYDAVVLAVPHNEFLGLDEEYFSSRSAEKAVFVDIKGLYRNKIKNMLYWSL